MTVYWRQWPFLLFRESHRQFGGRVLFGVAHRKWSLFLIRWERPASEEPKP